MAWVPIEGRVVISREPSCERFLLFEYTKQNHTIDILNLLMHPKMDFDQAELVLWGADL